jgi:hypothetical protein
MEVKIRNNANNTLAARYSDVKDEMSVPTGISTS